MMTKKDFISLADAIKWNRDRFTRRMIDVLADWCAAQNPNFNRARWMGYINDENGPNGAEGETT